MNSEKQFTSLDHNSLSLSLSLLRSMSIARTIHAKPDEHLVALYRAYGGTKLFSFAIAFVLFVVPFFLLAWLVERGVIGMIAFCLLLAFALWYSVRVFVGWYCQILVVTNQRVVCVRQQGLFDRSVSGLNLQSIQDVSYRIRGIFSTIARVGTVTILGAGSGTVIVFPQLRNPGAIVATINEARGTRAVAEPYA